VTFRVTWPFVSPGVISYKCSIITESPAPTIFEMGIFNIWVSTLTFLGHVTSSATWPFDSPGAISYRCSIVTESLSPTIFEIMGIAYIWVTTLTFLGHVTSSATWPFDSSGAISYRCSIVAESLSPTIFAICHFLLVSPCNRTSICNRFWDVQPPNRCAHTHTPRHTPQVILYSVPCNVLHWTDN